MVERQDWSKEEGKILKLDIDRWTQWLQYSAERQFIIFVARKQGYDTIKHGEKTLWTKSNGISL